MKKELFEQIMSSLNQRRISCFEYLGNIHTTEDLSQLSLAKAAELQQFCIEEADKMTKICMVDLYHIIGMGQLSPTQMMKFTYLMQEYLSYRPTIKVLAKYLNKISELPNIPVKTRFKLLGLGDATLTYGEGELIDEASVEDYADTKISTPEPPEDLPFTISGNQIKVDMARLEYFVELMEGLFKMNFSVDNLKKKINNLDEYLGIKWASLELDQPNQRIFAIGNLVAGSTRKKITVYYNKQEKKL